MADTRHGAVGGVEHFAVKRDPDMGMRLRAAAKYQQQEDRAAAILPFHFSIS